VIAPGDAGKSCCLVLTGCWAAEEFAVPQKYLLGVFIRPQTFEMASRVAMGYGALADLP
jgi:hypothetical protein